ncbi:MAG: flagellar type III secretion system pore protein FliP [Geothrix sp.]|uniref:Flagellar biosynthetic protein FliP n=1 Tax=Candidatus Geothrix odensensis TaxID=2954440 RepID=A0A936K4W6_9BACT|nr:flagellar type III secretion system pore protein FliP [Holophagaceae bacterium]MBK8571533.1 flagellar type III secretion system pore protein FliP [Candidatus Geothrix odensensis]MBK8788611.1 flagellar type III secretion system pore protein FliP [Holophagaceae bacterium]MCC6512976.1 flagellar type III secretion system pore protein FliP [Geothrix sp.]
MNRLLRWLPSILLLTAGLSLCAQQAAPLPSVTVDFGKAPSGPALSSSLQAMLLLTILTLAPTILMTATSFTRIVVVMHFLRQGLGTQQTPSNQVLISLSLVLTFFIMAPTAREINSTVLQPLQRNELTTDQALDRTSAPMKVFMLRHTRKKDLSLFLKIAKAPAPKTKADVPMECLLPAFLISELKTAFEIGFMIFLPFLVVDMVVASILLSMGMMMLPPVVISLPFKVLLFVLVDGWYLIVGSLVRGYTG